MLAQTWSFLGPIRIQHDFFCINSHIKPHKFTLTSIKSTLSACNFFPADIPLTKLRRRLRRMAAAAEGSNCCNSFDWTIWQRWPPHGIPEHGNHGVQLQEHPMHLRTHNIHRGIIIIIINWRFSSSLFTKMVETHKKEKKYSNNKNNLNYKQCRTY